MSAAEWPLAIEVDPSAFTNLADNLSAARTIAEASKNATAPRLNARAFNAALRDNRGLLIYAPAPVSTSIRSVGAGSASDKCFCSEIDICRSSFVAPIM